MFLHDIRINYTLFRRGGQLFSQNLQIMGTKPGAADVWVQRAAVTPGNFYADRAASDAIRFSMRICAMPSSRSDGPPQWPYSFSS